MKASVDSSACNNKQRQNKDKCRKKLVDKLGEDCAGNIHEVKMEKITSAEYENGHKLSAHCILCYFKNLCNQHWNWYLFCLLQIHES